MLPGTAGINLAITGFVDAALAAGHELVPLVWANACPSGPVTEDAFERLAAMLLEDLAAAGPLDALFLDLHGAMVTEHLDDGEGELLAPDARAGRPDLPIVAALDLHANVSEAMVAHSDALVAYRTYPHVDLAATGARCLPLLERLLAGERLAKAWRRIDFLIPLPWQCTTIEPGRSLYALLDELEAGERGLGLDLHGLPGRRHARSAARRCWPTRPTPAPAEAAVDAAGRAPSPRPSPASPAGCGRPRRRSRTPWRAGQARHPGRHPGQSGRRRQLRHDRAAGGADRSRAPTGASWRCCATPTRRRPAHAAGEGAVLHGLRARRPPRPGGRRAVRGDFDGACAWAAAGSPRPGRCMAATAWISGRWRCCARARRRASRSRSSSRRLQAADRAILHHLGVDPATRRILALKSSVHFRADFEPLAEEVLIVAAPGANIADPARTAVSPAAADDAAATWRFIARYG